MVTAGATADGYILEELLKSRAIGVAGLMKKRGFLRLGGRLKHQD